MVTTASGDSVRIYARWDGRRCHIITEKQVAEALTWEQVSDTDVVVQVAERAFRKEFEKISALLTLPRQ
jgi:hypothetical protein